MTFSNFEKYAAGKINNYASDVDAEGLWNDILPHVRKDDNRKRGLIWFFFVGLIAALAAFYTITDGNHSDSGSKNSSFSSANIVSTNINQESKQPTDNELVITGDSNNDKQNSSNTSNKSNTEKADFSKKINQSNSANNIEKKNKATYQNLETSVATSSSDKTEIIANSSTTISNSEETASEAENQNSNESEAIPADESQTTTELVFADTSSIMIGEEVVESNENNEEEKSLPPSRRFKLEYGVGLYGGYSSTFALLKDKSTLNEDYLQLRLQTEEQLETIQMGLDFMVKTEIGVYARTGIQYSRIARKFSLNSQIVTVDTVDGVQKIYVNPNTGDSTFVYGPVPVTTTTSYNKITYNYFHLMDIPIVVGYNYSSDDSNWSFGAEAGALINISMKTKGEIMAANGTDIYDMKDDPDKWFKDNIGVSFLASIMIAYNLDDNFQIYLSPTARLESIFSTEANPIEQKHGSLGVNLGARYFIGY